MRTFKHSSIREKLMWLIVLSSGIALLIAALGIVGYDSITFQQQKIDDLFTQAKILGATSTAALSFKDPKAAQEYLSAFNAKPDIVAAIIYDAEKKAFAMYKRRDSSAVPIPSASAEGYRVEGDDLLLFQNIVQDNEVIGTVYLRANLNQHVRLLRYAGIVLVVMAFSLLLALLVSTRLQAVVADPLLEVTRIAREVIQKKDYSLRAVKRTEDEIGVLMDAFNEMLAQIQQRETALQQANANLQQEVRQREYAQQALARKITDLARSNAELEQFAYVSSHDLQEPLRMVASFTQLLARRYEAELDAEGKEFLKFIVEGATRMQQLILDLLSFSRIGTAEMEFEPIEIDTVVKSALANLKVAIEESGAIITHDPLPTITGKFAQLTQLFQNLIGNSLKYRGKETPRVHIGVEEENTEWVFSVRDNGIGIEPQYFKQIFVIFQRLHVKSEYPGTGIGLAICKKIVESHGGKIWVESQFGKGTTFYFSLSKQPKEVNTS